MCLPPFGGLHHHAFESKAAPMLKRCSVGSGTQVMQACRGCGRAPCCLCFLKGVVSFKLGEVHNLVHDKTMGVDQVVENVLPTLKRRLGANMG